MTRSMAQGDWNLDHPSTLSRRRFLSQGGIAAVAAASALTAVGRGLAEPPPGQAAAAGPKAARESEAVLAPSFQGRRGRLGSNTASDLLHRSRKTSPAFLGSVVPRQAPGFQAWVQSQESLIARHWPWYIEEMRGVAEGIGKGYEEVLLLNLRAWQFNYYGAAQATHGCSSLAITLADGRVACAGALDDAIEYYCGPVRIAPDLGHRFISFPLAGTSWVTRGMNDAGFSVGISSQVLPGLRRLGHAVVQDVAMCAMLQTCTTVADAREFCRQHPFTLNLVCVDSRGGIFCASTPRRDCWNCPQAVPAPDQPYCERRECFLARKARRDGFSTVSDDQAATRQHSPVPARLPGQVQPGRRADIRRRSRRCEPRRNSQPQFDLPDVRLSSGEPRCVLDYAAEVVAKRRSVSGVSRLTEEAHGSQTCPPGLVRAGRRRRVRGGVGCACQSTSLAVEAASRLVAGVRKQFVRRRGLWVDQAEVGALALWVGELGQLQR